MIRSSFVFMLSLSVVASSAAALTAPIAPPSEVEALANTLQLTKSELAEQESHQRQVLSSLYQINRRMKEMSKKRVVLTNEMLAANGDVQTLAQSIAQLESRLREQRQELSKRLRSLYVMSGQNTLRVLFSSATTTELDRNLRFLKRISDRDYSLIRQYEKTLTALSHQRERLKGRVVKLVRIQDQLKRQEDMLLGQQQSKSKILDSLREHRTQQIAQMKQLRAKTRTVAGNRLDARLESLLNYSFFEKKGQLSPPTDQPIAKEFGFVQDDSYNFRLSHKGNFYAVKYGAQVKAISDGRVSFAGPLPGFGQTVIVDHGDHYYSVYAHNSAVAVRLGEEVRDGVIVAKAGNSSPFFGEGFYFEIRHFSDAIDPEPWFKNQGQARKPTVSRGAP